MVRRAMDLALAKINLAYSGLDLMFGGDLLNQIIAANLAARHVPVPFFGLFGACSTFSEALGGWLELPLTEGLRRKCWLVLRPTIRLRNDSFGIRQNWAFNVNRLHIGL